MGQKGSSGQFQQEQIRSLLLLLLFSLLLFLGRLFLLECRVGGCGIATGRFHHLVGTSRRVDQCQDTFFQTMLEFNGKGFAQTPLARIVVVVVVRFGVVGETGSTPTRSLYPRLCQGRTTFGGRRHQGGRERQSRERSNTALLQQEQELSFRWQQKQEGMSGFAGPCHTTSSMDVVR